ncbi:MAG: hypothetical protein GY943_39355, partial [Chloroflexi bacterium]|nr:hypothetical protein [Chloroflexota bacterium]
MTTTIMGETAVSRKPLFTFLGLVSILSALIYMLVFSGNEENAQGGLALLQFAPALSAIITKLIYQRNVRGLGWGWGKTRYQLVSLTLPFMLGLIGFGLVWLLGFGGFYNEAFIVEAQTGIAESFGVSVTSPYLVMLMLVLVNGTAGLLLAGMF